MFRLGLDGTDDCHKAEDREFSLSHGQDFFVNMAFFRTNWSPSPLKVYVPLLVISLYLLTDPFYGIKRFREENLEKVVQTGHNPLESVFPSFNERLFSVHPIFRIQFSLMSVLMIFRTLSPRKNTF